MRAVVQRVSQASVAVDGRVVGAIDEPGLLVLAGVTHTDTQQTATKLAAKLWGLRILEGEKSCSDVGAPLLVVSQFTLYAGTDKGRLADLAGRRSRPGCRTARRGRGLVPACAGRPGGDGGLRCLHEGQPDQRRPRDHHR